MPTSALFFLCVVLLAGCGQTEELEHMFYVHAIGIDYQDQKYTVYAQILDFTTFAKQEGSNGESATKEGAWVGKGIGDTILEAIHNLYATSQRSIYWGHLNAVVLHESVLKTGVQEAFDLMTRFNELRYTLWVFGTREPVQDVLLAAPILESTPIFSQIGDPDDVYKQSSFILRKRLYRVIYEMDEPSKTLLIPMLTLSRGHWSDRQEKFDSLRVGGVAILKGDQYLARMTRSQVKGVRWLQEETVRTPLPVGSPQWPEAALLLEHPEVKITPSVRGGQPYFNIDIKVKGSLSEARRKIPRKELLKKAEEQIRAEIRDTYREGLKRQADVLNLLDALYRKDVRQWKKLSQSGKFLLNESSLEKINVEVRIISGGRTLGPFSTEPNRSSMKIILIGKNNQ